MCLNVIETYGSDIVDGCSKTVGSHIVGSSCLKLERQALKGRLLPRHLVNHLSTTLIRRQLLQPFLLAIKHADACGSIHFMTAESIEVAVQLLHVNLHVGSALCTVYQDGNAARMCHFNDMSHVVDGAQHIADMGYAHQLCSSGKLGVKSGKVETAFVING